MFNKEVTLKQIGEYLKRFGWENFQEVPEPGEKEGIILTGWSLGEGEGHKVAIDPMVEKGSLLFRAREVAMAPLDSTASDRLNGLLLAMATMNYKMIIGSWGLDPTDGEVVFTVGMPIGSGDLDYDDFERALTVLVGSVEVQGRGLKEIIEGTKTAEQAIAAAGL